MKLRNWYQTSSFAGLHPIVYTLLIGTVIVNTARGMSAPFLAIYLMRHTGLSPATIGAIIGITPLTAMFGGFIGGMLSDKLGRRRVMLFSLFVSSFVMLGYAYFSNPLLLALTAAVSGLFGAFFEPVARVLMADLTTESKRMRVFSLRYLAINVGAAVGPLLGAYAGLSGGSAVYVIEAGVYFVYPIILQVLMTRFGIAQIEQEQTKTVSLKARVQVIFKDRALMWFVLGGIFTMTVFGKNSATLSQYLEKQFIDGTWLFSTLMSVNAIAVVLLQMPISRWGEKRRPFTSVWLGAVLFAVGNVGFAYSSNWTLNILSMIVFLIGEILVIPAETVMMDRITPDHMRGTYYGAQTFTGLGNFLGPWVGGLILGSFGGIAMFWMFSAVSLLAIVVYGFGQRVFEQQKEQRVHMKEAPSV